MTRTRRYRSDSEYIEFMQRCIRAADIRLDNCEVQELADLAETHRQLGELIGRVALSLSDRGFTWGEIGQATGTSKQAAHAKWSRKNPGPASNGRAH